MTVSAHQFFEIKQTYGQAVDTLNIFPLFVPTHKGKAIEIRQIGASPKHLVEHQDAAIDENFVTGKGWGKLYIHYLYRDANNFKQSEETVLPGELTQEAKAAILTALLHDSEGFVPGDMGLEDLQTRFGDTNFDEYDHPYHELLELKFTPCQRPEDGVDNIDKIVTAATLHLRNQ